MRGGSRRLKYKGAAAEQARRQRERVCRAYEGIRQHGMQAAAAEVRNREAERSIGAARSKRQALRPPLKQPSADKQFSRAVVCPGGRQQNVVLRRV